MKNIFKKILVCFLSCMILVCVLPFSVRADDSLTGRQITFEVESPYCGIYPDPPYWVKDVWTGYNLPNDSIGCFMRWGSSEYALLVCSLEGAVTSPTTLEKWNGDTLADSYNNPAYWGSHIIDVPDVINATLYTCGYMEQGVFRDYCTYKGWDCSVVGETYEDCLKKVYLYLKDGTVSEGMSTVDSVEGELPSDLGYLDEVFVKNLYLYPEDSYHYETLKKKISFSRYSTTGVDLLSGSYTIRLYEKFSCFAAKNPTVDIYPDLPLVLIGEYSPEPLMIEYDETSSWAKTCDVTGDIEGYNPFFILINRLTRCDNLYLQIVHHTTEGEICGGYLRLNGTGKTSDEDLSTMTTLNPDLTVDTSDGGFEDKLHGYSFGGGLSEETAEEIADKDYEERVNGGGGVSSSLNDIISQVGNMPQVIGKLFSFLPPWCLAFVGVGVGLWVTLMIVKAIRG